MLSREILNVNLGRYIRFFSSSDTENVSNLSTLQLLEKLTRVLSTPTHNTTLSLITSRSEQNRVQYLRIHLQRLSELERVDGSPANENYYDMIFALKITLAKGFVDFIPDTFEQEDIVDNNTPLVFFSNGTAHLKQSAEKFYQHRSCYNEAGEYLNFTGQPLSKREIISLQKQGVRFIQEPSSAEKFGKKLGKMLGILIASLVCGGSFIVLPINLIIVSAVSGCISLVSAVFSPGRSYAHAFVAGAIAASLILAVGCLAFPPLAALLVAAGAISSGAAASAFTVFTSMVLPFVPAAMIAAGIIIKYVTGMHYLDMVKKIFLAPFNLILPVTTKVYGFVGKLANALGKALHLIPTSLPKPPVVPPEERQIAEHLAEAAQVGYLTSTQQMFATLRIVSGNRDGIPAPQPQAFPPVPAPSAPIAPIYVFPATGGVRLGDWIEEREARTLRA
jgi:hypothetical protein